MCECVYDMMSGNIYYGEDASGRWDPEIGGGGVEDDGEGLRGRSDGDVSKVLSAEIVLQVDHHPIHLHNRPHSAHRQRMLLQPHSLDHSHTNLKDNHHHNNPANHIPDHIVDEWISE